MASLAMLRPVLPTVPLSPRGWCGQRGAGSCAHGVRVAVPEAPAPSIAAPLRATAAAVGAAATALCAVARRSRGGSRGGEDSLSTAGGALVIPMDQSAGEHMQEKLFSVAGSMAKDDRFAPLFGSMAEDDRWRINLLYDGDCHVCKMQVEFLTKRMHENPEYAGLVRLTNLADPNYDPEACGGVRFEDGMRHIHAVTREGEVVTGVEVFRHVYRMVGMEWVYSLTSLPVIGRGFDWLYDLWAENRLQLTGRADVLDQIHEHQKNIEELSTMECEMECEIDWD